ncbi:HD domain-containing protein [Candidatus Woesearchaeota archaeon]|nr:HD domain-containing protein [Candidatus Woesearchaeota archaeon]
MDYNVEKNEQGLMAVKSSIGRRHPEQYPVLADDPFMNDYLKITQCKAFRRLAGKTQVLFSPQNPHVRTRAVHTQEVIATAYCIAEHLGLNTSLCMAIAAGHDIGHGPYGHAFEHTAKELGRDFSHNVNSVVVAQHVEWKGKGLNPHFETLEGILKHSSGGQKLVADSSFPQEYAVVMIADKFAYTMSDINDMIRYKLLDRAPDLAMEFGCEQRERTNTCIRALVEESREKGNVSFVDSDVAKTFYELRNFMFDNVYGKVSRQDQVHVLKRVYSHFSGEPEFEGIDPLLLLSLLTDKEALDAGNVVFHLGRWDLSRLHELSVLEIIKYLRNRNIDITDPDLGWKEDAVR